MPNITTAPGGATVVDGVVTYLPQCSGLSYSSVSAAGAAKYDITIDYLTTLVPSIVPGVVFATLALIGFLFFLTWASVQCCRRRHVLVDAQQQQQFLSSSDPKVRRSVCGSAPSPPPTSPCLSHTPLRSPPSPPPPRRARSMRRHCCRLLRSSRGSSERGAGSSPAPCSWWR